MTTEKDFKAHLHTIGVEDWEKFFGLIPEIEKSKKFEEIHETEITNGVTRPAFRTPLKVVQDFLYLFHELDLKVIFSWTNWTEGHNMLNQQDFDFEQQDTYTLCKLLTTIVRADRFNEGFLSSRFEDGTILRILRAIQKNKSSLSESTH